MLIVFCLIFIESPLVGTQTDCLCVCQKHTHLLYFALLDWNTENKFRAQQVQTEDKWRCQTV